MVGPAYACGCSATTQLPKKIRRDQLEELILHTKLQPKEVKALYARFRRMAPLGYLDQEQFRSTMGVLGLTDDSFLPDRMFRVFDSNQDGRLSFNEFSSSLAVMIRGTEDEKLRLSFEMTAGRHGAEGIALQDFQRLVSACNTMMSSLVTPFRGLPTAEDADRLFQQLATKQGDGEAVITLESYKDAAHHCTEFLELLGLESNVARERRADNRYNRSAPRRGTTPTAGRQERQPRSPSQGGVMVSPGQLEDLRERVLRMHRSAVERIEHRRRSREQSGCAVSSRIGAPPHRDRRRAPSAAPEAPGLWWAPLDWCRAWATEAEEVAETPGSRSEASDDGTAVLEEIAGELDAILAGLPRGERGDASPGGGAGFPASWRAPSPTAAAAPRERDALACVVHTGSAEASSGGEAPRAAPRERSDAAQVTASCSMPLDRVETDGTFASYSTPLAESDEGQTTPPAQGSSAQHPRKDAAATARLDLASRGARLRFSLTSSGEGSSAWSAAAQNVPGDPAVPSGAAAPAEARPAPARQRGSLTSEEPGFFSRGGAAAYFRRGSANETPVNRQESGGVHRLNTGSSVASTTPKSGARSPWHELGSPTKEGSSSNGQHRKVPRRHRLLGPKKGLAVHFGHENWNMVLSMMIGIRMSVGRVRHEIARELQPVDFMIKEKFSIIPRLANIFDSTVSRRVAVTRFVDYAPLVFQRIRAGFGIRHEDYLKSVGPEQLLGNMILGNLSSLSELSSEGKSGAFFYYTADGKYMMKTVTPKEHTLLKKMLRSYFHHLQQNPGTLICRFLGLHCLRVQKFKRALPKPKAFGRSNTKNYVVQKLYFVVMGNMFNTPFEIHRRYDLKGSWVGRVTPPDYHHPSICLKDVDFTNANETIQVGGDRRAELVAQIERDSEFLRDNAIIDYSLLLGICEVNNMDVEPDLSPKDSNSRATSKGIWFDVESCPDEEQLSPLPSRYPSSLIGVSPTPTSNTQDDRARGRLDSSNHWSSVQDDPASQDDKAELPLGVCVSERPVFQRDFGGLLSSDRKVIYFIGIIDILTSYDNSKKLEQMLKALYNDPKGVSCCPPAFYAERFNCFMRRAFV